jgi:hypothetical protein
MIGFINTFFYNQLQQLTINDCLRLASFSFSFSDLSLSLMLRPTVSRQVCLGTKHPFEAYDQILIIA